VATLIIEMSKKALFKFFLLLLGCLSFLLITKEVVAGWVLTSEGQLIFESSVLGKKNESVPPGLQKAPGQAKKESAETQTQTGPKTMPPGQEAKTVRLKPKGYQLEITVEDEKGEEIEIPEGTESAEFEIEDPEPTTKIRSMKNSYAVIRNKIAAQTHFPLMVNLETNELIVTTPKGQKVVTVLPDKAVQNMLAANVIDQLGGKGGLLWLEYQASLTPTATPSATPTATESATPTPGEATEAGELEISPTPEPTLPEEEIPPVEEIITLTTTNEGDLAYEIPGIKFKKLFGMIKIKLDRTVLVSAETGELLGIRQALLARILDLLSVSA
jgi:hypothetical protein